MLKPKPPITVGLTMGDPSGIGAEIIAKAIPRIKGWADFVVIGDRGVFNKTWGRGGFTGSGFTFVDVANVNLRKFKFGKVSREYGLASVQYLDMALKLWGKKRIDCLVTCPISKESIHKAGYHFSGHTEYFAQRLNCKNTVMMLLNEKIRVGLVTRHIPLKDVAGALRAQNIRVTIVKSVAFVKKAFGCRSPRVAVCGVNPHASDNGVIGREEEEIILPVVRSLKKSIPGLRGPLPAEVAMAKAAGQEYDCVIAMYHDQALIALKALGDKSGVNVTLGLPLVRTSPLHGTAFDIAGQGKASCDSFIAAVKCAILGLRP